MTWNELRNAVWKRDKGICSICKFRIEWNDYECGHIVDRCCGGTDELVNLTVMCTFCNRIIKELHETKEDYEQWLLTHPYDRFQEKLYKQALNVIKIGQLAEID